MTRGNLSKKEFYSLSSKIAPTYVTKTAVNHGCLFLGVEEVRLPFG